MSLPAHQCTTRHLGAAYPFAAEPGLGAQGVLVGRDLLGGAFVYDPFVLYGRGVLTNPNVVVFGQLGRGKSALVKTYLWRQAVFGRRAWVIDPKGEYGSLAEAFGTRPLSLAPGGVLRVNPLDVVRGDADAAELVRRRAELVCALAASGMGRPLAPHERAAIELAVDAVSSEAVPTLPEVVDSLLEPSSSAAATLHTDATRLAADGRSVALELRRLVRGDLQGMFDGRTSAGVDLDSAAVVLDLSSVYHSPALGMIMACAVSWLHGRLGARPAEKTVLVVDEAWAVLSDVGVARWLRSSWKLARARGVSNVAVLHRVSDLSAAGPAGSEQAAAALGLLADSETRVLYAQAPGEMAVASDVLGLSATEAELVPTLGRGVALWKVGARSFLVRHRISPPEAHLVDTDRFMVGDR